MKIVVLLSIFVSVAICTIGVDISTAVSTADLSCLAKQGYSFSIIRCFQSTGSVDPNCASNVANSHAAGMENVDIYMFPCFKCGNAFDQMSALLNYTQGKGVKYNTLWLDIEGTQYWGSVSDNVAFMQQLLEAGEHLGALMGVYTSSSQWTPIMGSSTIGSAYPVWYAHYNNEQSFSDFTPFGGWKTPTMKQYNGDQTVCGAGVDLNWIPGGDTTTGATTHAAATTATHAATTATHAATTTHDTATTATHAATTHAATTHAAATSGDHSAAGTTGTQTSQSSYSGSGSSSSDSGSDFRFLDRAIYNAKLGGNKIPLAKESPVKKDAYIKKDTNTKKETNTEKDTNTKKEIPTVKEAPKMKAPSTVREAKKISVKFTEVEDALQKGEHFKVLEEKAFNKF